MNAVNGRWLLVVPAALFAFVLAFMLRVLATPVMQGLTVETDLAFDGALAGALVVVAGALVAPRARFAVALALYVTGALVAWLLCGAEDVWPTMALVLAGTYLGGALAIAWVGARYGSLGLAASIAIALGLAAALGGLAIVHSQRFGNRGASAILHTTTRWGNTRHTRVRWIYDQRGREESWTWARSPREAWVRELKAQPTIGFEGDIGSGPVPACATIVDSDAARRQIEELIRAWWERNHPTVAAPSPDLTGHLPIRLSHGDCVNPVAD